MRQELKNRRVYLNMTQEEVAKKVGINRSYYGFIENGKRNPTYKVANKIADTLSSSIDELFPQEIFFAGKCYNMKL